jgi:histone H3/H4
MKLNYYTKHVYGQPMIYLADNKAQIAWHNLTGRKTITNEDMQRLTTLTGVTFERVFEPNNVTMKAN